MLSLKRKDILLGLYIELIDVFCGFNLKQRNYLWNSNNSNVQKKVEYS